MTVLIDTNVALDILLNNAGFADNSKALFDFADEKRFIGYISASAITDIFYISQLFLRSYPGSNAGTVYQDHR